MVTQKAEDCRQEHDATATAMIILSTGRSVLVWAEGAAIGGSTRGWQREQRSAHQCDVTVLQI